MWRSRERSLVSPLFLSDFNSEILQCPYGSIISRDEIRGFGSFVVRQYGGYNGRNPKTGKTVDVAPKRLRYFKIGKVLKEKVNTIKGKVV